MQHLKEEITRLTSGSQEDMEVILGMLKPIELQKGDFLLKASQVCRHYYFIESGAVRLYYWNRGEDYTVWIGTAGQIFTDLESYLEEVPSRINIEAIAPTLAYTLDKSQSDQLARNVPVYNTLLRRTVEIAFVNLAKNVISFQSQEAQERYQRVEKEKDWLQKYPLKYISSFIGITQSSLSRLRARKD